jgi:hypothetical protein
MILVACGSKELSRSKAAKLIKEKYYTSQMIQDGAQRTQITEMKGSLVGQSGNAMIPGYNLSDLRNYEKAGWITLVVRSCQTGTCFVDVSLTSKGVEESKGWKKISNVVGEKVWEVPIFQREFVEVTGITSSEPSSAVVEFTSRWIPTEKGKEMGAVPSAPKSSTANFRLYDDGWRLVG